ncbi:MAG: hypothetical protein KDD58_11560 [Bdellovibrionales bacterium]|nr:hypothetical protein [Bdellovibrionales bacterium]
MAFYCQKRIHWLLAIFITTSFLISCTRDTNSDKNASLVFNVSPQKMSSSLSTTTSYLNFISVNVSAPGAPRRIWKWDAHDYCSGNCVTPPLPPNPIKINDIPSGNGRLIQVLLVYEDDATENMTFSYGDKLADLKGGDNDVSITVQDIGSSSGGESGVQGRYLMADGTAVTSEVAMKFSPPNGRPAMEIMRSEMFAGWIDLFLLNDVSFEYEIVNQGQILFGTKIKTDSSVFATSNSVVKMKTVPTYYDKNNDNTYEVGVDEYRAESTLYLGFWKGGVADSSATVSYEQDTSLVSDHDYTKSDYSTYLTWRKDFTLTGGSEVNNLPTSLVTQNNMTISGQAVINGGGGGLLFRGPFMKFLTANGDINPIEVIHNASTGGADVKWKYLPGVFNGIKPIKGVAVFYQLNSTVDRFGEGDDGGDCKQLHGMGFQSIPVNGSAETASIPNVASAEINKLKVILCPVRADGSYSHMVVETENYNSGGGEPYVTFGTPSPPSGSISTVFNFPVTYYNVDTVTLSDLYINLITTGTVSCANTVVQNGSTFTPNVQVSNCSGNGTLGVSVAGGTGMNSEGMYNSASDPSPLVSVANISCPVGYIPVPGNPTYGTSDFCVMKYEAKNDGGPVSQAAGNPWVSINKTDAAANCQGIGVSYSLITNDEWQTIARNIENVSANWSSSTMGTGHINRGHSDNSPSTPCDGSNEYVDTNCTTYSGGFEQKRTHQLSNGEVIWDLAGNVMEWVLDTNSYDLGATYFIFDLTDGTPADTYALSGGLTSTSRNSHEHFGPEGNYISLNVDPFGGFGQLNHGTSGGILRGGLLNGGTQTGIFATTLNQLVTFSHTLVGYRCVYRP